MKKHTKTQITERKKTDFRSLAELLSNWFDRHEAEWKANGVSEEKITQLKDKVSRSRAGGGDQ